jgi:subtilisin family serine protease
MGCVRPLCIAFLLALALAPGAVRAEAPADALEAAIARSVLDRGVLEAVREAGHARVLVVFRRVPGARADAAPDALRARLAAIPGAPGLRRYEGLPLLAGHVDLAALRLLVADPAVAQVSLDRRVQAQLGESAPLSSFDWMRAGGFDGSGATVAVVDTGVDGSHPDLAAHVVDEYCYCDDGFPGPFGCCPGGQDDEGGPGAAQDDNGHGTRVVSVVTSDGVHADLGSAPAAGVVVVKVLGVGGGGFLSDIISGINWVRLNHPGIAALNLSLGFGFYPGDCDGADSDVDAIDAAIDLIQTAGTLVVAGSGNNRSGTHMIAPACLADVISVGGVWDADVGAQTIYGCTDATTAPDQVTCWSNANAGTDVFASGGRVTASQLNGTTVVVAGTSFATPFVATCAALLAEEYPSASLADLETALETSPVSVQDVTNGLWFPRLDCVAAYHALPEPGGAASLVSGMVLLHLLRGRAARRRAGTRLRVRRVAEGPR